MTDFTWKQNRLSKDKEALKAQMMGIIKRKPAQEKKEQKKEDDKNAAFANTVRKDPNAMAQLDQGQGNNPQANSGNRGTVLGTANK